MARITPRLRVFRGGCGGARRGERNFKSLREDMREGISIIFVVFLAVLSFCVFWAAILILLKFWVSDVEAQYRPLPQSKNVVFLVDRNRYMPRHLANKIVSGVIASMPIKFSYRLKTSPRHQCNDWVKNKSDIGERAMQLRCLEQVRKGERGRVLFLVEPLVENGIIYTAGIANSGCKPSGTALCNVTRINQAGAAREEHGKIACAHELAHLYNAKHDENMYGGCPSIMHSAPLPSVGVCPMGFSGFSSNQIKACVMR